MIIDILFGISLIYGFYLGFKNEPLNKIFKLFPYLMGFLTGVYLAPVLYDKLAEMFGSDGVILFLITFVICCFTGWSFSKHLVDLFTSAAKMVNIKRPEKILNGLTLSFIFIIIFSGLVAFFNKASIISDHQKDTSLSLPVMESLPEKIKDTFVRLKPGFKKFYEKSSGILDHKN